MEYAESSPASIERCERFEAEESQVEIEDKRRCILCGDFLATYNKSDRCFHHDRLVSVNPTADRMLEAVLHVFDIKREDLRNKNPTKRIRFARQIATFLLREDFKFSYSSIGRLFDQHHTNISFVVRKMHYRLERDEKTRFTLNRIRRMYSSSFRGTSTDFAMPVEFAKTKTSPGTILKAVRFFFGLPDLSKRVPKRSRLLLARQIAAYLLREETELSFPGIGRFLRQHQTTILHSHRVIESLLNSDEKIRWMIREIRSLYGKEQPAVPIIAKDAHFLEAALRSNRILENVSPSCGRPLANPLRLLVAYVLKERLGHTPSFVVLELDLPHSKAVGWAIQRVQNLKARDPEFKAKFVSFEESFEKRCST